jgi:hypothetical protein
MGWLDHDWDKYVGVTVIDILAAHGRRVFVDWTSNWDYRKDVPITRWRSAMPCRARSPWPAQLRACARVLRPCANCRPLANPPTPSKSNWS